jgi:tRNA (Thr-GGU) A37 N-methylase
MIGPNPIAMTSYKIEGIDESDEIAWLEVIDAFDGTADVDLKAYFPEYDRVEEYRVLEWVSDWPEWMPEGGFGL